MTDLTAFFSVAGICILWYIITHSKEKSRFKRLEKISRELGILRENTAGTHTKLSYNELMRIIILSGNDVWIRDNNDIRTAELELICRGAEVTDDPIRHEAILTYISVFNPRLMRTILHRLHRCEWTLHAIQTMAQPNDPALTTIRIGMGNLITIPKNINDEEFIVGITQGSKEE